MHVQTWAEVSNLPVQELNIMEIEYLTALNYELFVSEQEYLHWLKECETYVARQGQYMQQYASAMLRPTKVATGARRVSPPPSSRNPSLPSINISKLMPVPLATTTVQKRGFSDMGYEHTSAKRPNVYGVQPQNNLVLPNTPPHYGGGYKVPLVTPIPTYPQMPLSPAYTPPSSQPYYSAPVMAFDYVPYNTSTLTVAAPVPLYPAPVIAPSLQYYNSSNPRRASYQQQQLPFGNSNMAFSSDFTFQSAIVM
ncbi:hypothetical protein BC937DRAFT_87287 [Endogone sp. FLAS-F59071]|nr:hypothetical protein BC937DRAFT_87287 [Endogone sp. FLAS-F59071]|eukprot:RUS12669.1 hypothetical protein BC937DRAFT_87287 [Endogone sp. FLAS-F59071]